MAVQQQTVDAHSHVVHFYEQDDELVGAVAGYLRHSLHDGGVGIVIATADHRRAFSTALIGAGVDVEGALLDGSLVLLDAAEVLAMFMVDGRPDPARFDLAVGTMVRDLAEVGQVAAYGEMVALLWDEGQVTAAIELEALWNDLGEALPFSLFCAYPLAAFAADQLAELHTVCHLHTEVFGNLDADGHGVASREFIGTRGVTEARHFVVSALLAGDHGALADNAAMVVTELATNAVLHARTSFAVTVLVEDAAVRIAIRDSSTLFPQPRAAGPTALGGRGLGLVGAVARWGVEPVRGGKTVWAELRPTLA